MARIYGNIRTRVCEYSCHKFASNVIEKCVRGADWTLVKAVIEEIAQDAQEPLLQVVSDKFGNYVIQKCAEVLVKVTQDDPGVDHAEAQERREVHDFFFSQLVTVFRQNPQLIAPNPSQGKGKQK